MRCLHVLLLTLCIALVASPAFGGPRTHKVAKGQTLGKIAKRYHVTVNGICRASGISRKSPIRPGQRLRIPDRDDPEGKRAAEELKAQREQAKAKQRAQRDAADARVARAGMLTLPLPGADAFYYEPVGPGRLSMRPVLMYLHGRGGSAAADCRRWAPVARRVGWLVCPQGPEQRNSGRGWDNNWPAGHRVVMSALDTLRKKYGRRVQLYGNTLIGFSEGAYVAMNVGVREPRAFNRWLVLAADTQYWGVSGLQSLDVARSRLRRVYLITGEQDIVVDRTREVHKWLKKARVSTKLRAPKDMGHELALSRKAGLYRQALLWLQKG